MDVDTLTTELSQSLALSQPELIYKGLFAGAALVFLSRDRRVHHHKMSFFVTVNFFVACQLLS